MANFSRRSADASRQRLGSPMRTGIMCDCDDIIGIPACRNARRVLWTCSQWAARSAAEFFRCRILSVAAAAIGGGIAVVKIKLDAAERIASQITASDAM